MRIHPLICIARFGFSSQSLNALLVQSTCVGRDLEVERARYRVGQIGVPTAFPLLMTILFSCCRCIAHHPGFQRRYRCAWIWWATLCGTILTAMIIWSCLSSKPVIMLALTIGYGLVIVIVPALAILGYAKSSESERDRERVNDAVEENFEVRWVEWVENETSSYKFTEEVKAGVVESGDEASCAICLSEYELNDDIRGLPCGHAFHAECFAECFHGLPRGRKASQHRCPLCRASLGPVLPRRLIDGSYEVTDIATPTPDGDLEVGVADEEAGNN